MTPAHIMSAWYGAWYFIHTVLMHIFYVIDVLFLTIFILCYIDVYHHYVFPLHPSFISTVLVIAAIMSAVLVILGMLSLVMMSAQLQQTP